MGSGDDERLFLPPQTSVDAGDQPLGSRLLVTRRTVYLTRVIQALGGAGAGGGDEAGVTVDLTSVIQALVGAE